MVIVRRQTEEEVEEGRAEIKILLFHSIPILRVANHMVVTPEGRALAEQLLKSFHFLFLCES